MSVSQKSLPSRREVVRLALGKTGMIEYDSGSGALLYKLELCNQVVHAYLSRQHFDDVENSCPTVALPTDVARSGVAARRAFETVFRAMVSVFERSMAKNSKPRRPATQSIAALCIGGMIVARTVADTELADELRASCLTVARGIGGWDKNTGGKSRKSRRR